MSTPPVRKNLSLAQSTLKGIFWLVGSRMWSQILSLTVGVTLARLLEPEDYGIMGMAIVLNGFLGILSDFGLGTAIIQKQDLQDKQLSSIFWFNIIIGIAIAVVLVGISPFASRFYGESQLIAVMSTLSLNFVLAGTTVVPNALLLKSMRFDLTSRITMASSLLAGICGIVASLLGVGVWALVVQSVSTTFMTTVASWYVSKWKPDPHFTIEDLQPVFAFSLHLLGFQTFNYVARNVDRVLIGRFLGAELLGAYSLAYNLMLYPITNITNVIAQATFPAFAKIQNDSTRLAEAYIKTCRYLAFIILPAMSGLAVMSRQFIVTVYGQKWIDSVQVLAFLCVVATFQPFVSLAGTLLVARGLTSWFFRWSMIVSPLMILSFIVGLRWGINGVAACYLVAQALVTVIGMPLQLRVLEIPLRRLLKSVKVPVLSTTVMVCAVWLARSILAHRSGFTSAKTLLACVAIGIISYGICLIALHRYFWAGMLSDLRDLRKNTPPVAESG